MTRITIDLLVRQMHAAYRTDPFHALRRNVESVRPDEWDVRPAGWTVEEFGTQPELSICDLVVHIAGAKHMYADRAFGDASLEWGDIVPPALDRESVVAWLDEGHRKLVDGLSALQDDAELLLERPAPWRIPMRRGQLIAVVMNHDVYHSGEINRQRALIRGVGPEAGAVEEEARRYLRDGVRGRTDADIDAFVASTGGHRRLLPMVFEGFCSSLNPGEACVVQFDLARAGSYFISATPGSATPEKTAPANVDATVRVSRQDFLRWMTADIEFAAAAADGRISVEGNASALGRLLSTVQRR